MLGCSIMYMGLVIECNLIMMMITMMMMMMMMMMMVPDGWNSLGVGDSVNDEGVGWYVVV